MYNGVDAEVFRPRDGAGLREQAGLDARRRIVLYVGNRKADKGLLDLLDARVVEACRREGAALVIIGGGPLRPRLEREVRERTLHDDVRLLGPKAPEEVARWMGIADCLCLPSHHEGIPNVILEALSCGLPVRLHVPGSFDGASRQRAAGRAVHPVIVHCVSL